MAQSVHTYDDDGSNDGHDTDGSCGDKTKDDEDKIIGQASGPEKPMCQTFRAGSPSPPGC